MEKEQKQCVVEDCQKSLNAKGFCSMHLARLRTHGSLEIAKPKHSGLPEDVRFWKYVQITDDCWLWTGCVDRTVGYGEFGRAVTGRKIRVHRYVYELIKGPIPSGLQIDHLCRVRICVNPDHLEAVTQQENIRRGQSPPANNARKTHCVRGHELNGSNLIPMQHGHRRCRICRNGMKQ